jgi:ubiquinone/menaquinone biosynthesis C-methylase UbiE
MSDGMNEYLLARAADEIERLRSWGRIWEPDAEAMLDHIGIEPGWRCVDLGCGPMGILPALSRRVGPSGQVVGVDISAQQLAAARELAEREGLTNVELVKADVFDTELPRASFDLVHVRFVFTPLGRDQALMRELLSLVRPGGVVVTEEADDCSYLCYPPQPAWERLQALTAAAFARAGGDVNTGRRIYRLLRHAGLVDVQARAAALALPAGHPFRRWPLESTMATRPKTREWGLMAEHEWEQVVAECERIVNDPDTFLLSFMVVQTWGRKPARSS